MPMLYKNGGYSFRNVEPDYLPQAGEAFLPEGASEAEIAAAFPGYVAATPVPPAITRRQLLIQLKTAGLITAAEAVASAQTGAVPASVQAVFDALPTQADKDNAAITWAAMSVAERTNPLVAALAASAGMNSAQIDDFFRAAAAV